MVSDPESKELVLEALHPGVTIEQVKEATGWRLRVAPSLSRVPEPTAEELTALRELYARTAAAHRNTSLGTWQPGQGPARNGDKPGFLP